MNDQVIYILAYIYDDSMAELVFRPAPLGAHRTKESAERYAADINKDWETKLEVRYADADPFVTRKMQNPFYGLGTILYDETITSKDGDYFLIYPTEIQG